MPLRPKPTQPGNNAGPTPAELLAKMPRRPMTPEQQAAALEKVQQQATQRVKLGQQLFEAAEARLKQHQEVLKEIQGQQQVLRDKVQEDVAKSLQTYDQWMGRIDESFTNAIKDLNGRLDLLESRFEGSRGEMEAMIGKAAALLEQTQGLMTDAFGTDAAAADPAPLPPTPMQDAVSADPGQDVDIFEVDIIEPDTPVQADSHHTPSEGAPTGDDVFGEVLKRLRAYEDGDDDGQAAA